MKITHTEDVAVLRKQEYPPIEDFADALYWQSRGDSNKMTSYLARVDEVKKRFPKKEAMEILRERKEAEINAARMFANRTYFTFQNKQVACDDLSWNDIISANAEISLTREMPEGWVGGWKTMDDSYVVITDVATWILFIKAMVSRGTTHFNHSQQLKSLLAAAETPEQIAAINWETLIV